MHSAAYEPHSGYLFCFFYFSILSSHSPRQLIVTRQEKSVTVLREESDVRANQANQNRSAGDADVMIFPGKAETEKEWQTSVYVYDWCVFVYGLAVDI